MKVKGFQILIFMILLSCLSYITTTNQHQNTPEAKCSSFDTYLSNFSNNLSKILCAESSQDNQINQGHRRLEEETKDSSLSNKLICAGKGYLTAIVSAFATLNTTLSPPDKESFRALSNLTMAVPYHFLFLGSTYYIANSAFQAKCFHNREVALKQENIANICKSTDAFKSAIHNKLNNLLTSTMTYNLFNKIRNPYAPIQGPDENHPIASVLLSLISLKSLELYHVNKFKSLEYKFNPQTFFNKNLALKSRLYFASSVYLILEAAFMTSCSQSNDLN